ncbi:hypothetical protein V6N13_094403 [Hibiscus sabdariffa]
MTTGVKQSEKDSRANKSEWKQRSVRTKSDGITTSEEPKIYNGPAWIRERSTSGDNQDINTAPTKPDQRCTEQINIDRGCVGQLNNDTSNFVQVESDPATSAQVNVDQASIEHAVSDQFEIAEQELRMNECEGCYDLDDGPVTQAEGIPVEEGVGFRGVGTVAVPCCCAVLCFSCAAVSSRPCGVAAAVGVFWNPSLCAKG